MSSKNIVDSRLFIRLDLSSALLTNDSFQNTPLHKAHLASQFLLYDGIVIPTTDFGIVPTLISWLGLNTFRDAISSSSIRFIRRHGLLAYNGGGLGLGIIGIQKGKSTKWEWWQEALFHEEDSASLELQLMHRVSGLSHRQQRILVRDILRNTSRLPHNSEVFTRNIAEESYKDIIRSMQLSQAIFQLGKRPEVMDLQNLIPPTKTRVLNQPGNLQDEVDLILRVAEINMELLMAHQSENADLITSEGAENILKEKIISTGIQAGLVDSFISLVELKNIPDIRPAIASGDISMQQIWKLRQGFKSKRFREWLREINPSTGIDLQRAYIDALERETLADSLPTTLLRFAATSLAGVINPLLALGVSVADSFFIDKILKGYSPKLFFDELLKLSVRKKAQINLPN